MTWAPEATPQTAREVCSAPRCPEVVEAAVARGITSIVHFTRIRGLVGILAGSAVKARKYLPEDDRLKYVYEPNAADRSRDARWLGYVNLSVSSINVHMFQFSESSHPGDQWVILEFGPEILGDPGVVFCTTNNAYEVARRCTGLRGFDQMFDEKVPWGHHGDAHFRYGCKPNRPTDPQAEVLYPFELTLDHLHTITVREEKTCEAAEGALSHFLPGFGATITPKAFR